MQNSWIKIGTARGKVSCVFLAVILFGSLLHAQTTWYVATNGVDNTDVGRGMSWDLPFATVSNAYRSASSTLSDMILVSNGTYLLSQHVLVNKPVVISGFNTPGQTNTIIDGQDSVRGFLIRHPQSVVEGLMIINGNPGADGGGVNMTNGILRNCIVAFNTGRRGGGVYQQFAGVISNCVIYGNTAGEPGGLYGGGGVVLVSNGEIYDSVISNNTATSGTRGGGIDVGADAVIVNCHVIDNEATGGGGGIGVRDSHSVVSNTTIALNYAASAGGGIYSRGGLDLLGGSIVSNATATSGGGIVFMNAAMGEVRDVLVHGNKAQYGGGIYVYGQALISNCNVIANSSTNSGGGGIVIHTTGGAGIATVTHSRVIGNIAASAGDVLGGGIRVTSVAGPVVIAHSEISGNSVTNANRARGGGIYISSNTFVRNCLIAGNWISGDNVSDGGQGGGIYITDNSPGPSVVESCTIVTNYARLAGGGVYLRGDGDDVIYNCIVASNVVAAGDNNWYLSVLADRKTNITYTCTPDADGTWGAGCTSADPLFVNPGTGNYRLRAGSPGINAGLNQMDWMPGAMDLDGRPRIDRFSGVVDMGCYEYISSGAMFYVY